MTSGRTEEEYAHNIGLPKAGRTQLNQRPSFYLAFVLADSFVLLMPRLRQAENRCMPPVSGQYCEWLIK